MKSEKFICGLKTLFSMSFGGTGSGSFDGFAKRIQSQFCNIGPSDSDGNHEENVWLMNAKNNDVKVNEDVPLINVLDKLENQQNGFMLSDHETEICDKLLSNVVPDVENNSVTIGNLNDKLTDNNDLIDDNDDERFRLSVRVKRLSSLKSSKTPPGTPRAKKIVRFADVLGLDLTDVRTFIDDLPQVPSLEFNSDQKPFINSFVQTTAPKKVLIPLFQQPFGLPNFIDLLSEKNVMLESAIVEDPVCLSISGVVHVRNIAYEKNVFVRYTLNSWQTFSDLKCSYLSNSCDGFSDKFTFVIYGHNLEPGQRLEFAICYQCNNSQFWDNNRGHNYVFQCMPASSSNNPFSSLTTAEDKWIGGAFY